MKYSIYANSHSVNVTLEIKLSEHHRVEVRVSRRSRVGQGLFSERATVHWPSIGNVNADDATQFAAAVDLGARIAFRLDGMKEPQLFNETDMDEFAEKFGIRIERVAVSMSTQ